MNRMATVSCSSLAFLLGSFQMFAVMPAGRSHRTTGECEPAAYYLPQLWRLSRNFLHLFSLISKHHRKVALPPPQSASGAAVFSENEFGFRHVSAHL